MHVKTGCCVCVCLCVSLSESAALQTQPVCLPSFHGWMPACTFCANTHTHAQKHVDIQRHKTNKCTPAHRYNPPPPTTTTSHPPALPPAPPPQRLLSAIWSKSSLTPKHNQKAFIAPSCRRTNVPSLEVSFFFLYLFFNSSTLTCYIDGNFPLILSVIVYR